MGQVGRQVHWYPAPWLEFPFVTDLGVSPGPHTVPFLGLSVLTGGTEGAGPCDPSLVTLEQAGGPCTH